jgi:hypothetical protein
MRGRSVVLGDRAYDSNGLDAELKAIGVESMACVDATRGVLVFSPTTCPTSKQRSALAKFPALVARPTAVVL